MTPFAPLVVFGYAFPHRKTQDFLVELVTAGYRDLTVIAAPMKALALADNNRYFPTGLRRERPLETSALCHALGLQYHEVPHDDIEAVAGIAAGSGARTAIISGARILKRGVIDCFPDGVVNFHPGKLPETAGLDLFYYTILRNIPLGITAHYIDHRVDAGRQIFFLETEMGPADSPETILENNYQSQIGALRRFLALFGNGTIDATPVDRPAKNEPMTPEAKRAVLMHLPDWCLGQHLAQQERRFFAAIAAGDTRTVSALIDRRPSLLSLRTPEGWTPLIVACHHQQREIAALLLQRGADPNAGGGRNGTTPLMYAKAALLHRPNRDPGLLELLLAQGARLDRTDALGQDILHYVEQAGDADLAAWLRLQGEM